MNKTTRGLDLYIHILLFESYNNMSMFDDDNGGAVLTILIRPVLASANVLLSSRAILLYFFLFDLSLQYMHIQIYNMSTRIT